VVADHNYQLRVWSFANGKPIRSFGESFTNVFLPIGDKPTTAVVEQRGSSKGVLQSLVPGADGPTMKATFPAPVAVSPDGKYLLAHWRDLSFGIIYVVRLRDGAVIDSLDPCLSDEIFTSSTWSSDGRRIYAGSWRGQIYEFDFNQVAAGSAAAFVPANQEQLDLCHARWF
jgi:WD40 repeat protein